MGTVSSARAIIGLTASATPTRTNVSGAKSIGEPSQTVDYPDADIAYAFTVTSTGSSDVATLDLATGDVAQTTGTPTIVDAGVDFEGLDLATAVRIYAVEAVADDANTGGLVGFSGTSTPYGQSLKPGGKGLSTNEQTSPGTMAITFFATGDVVTVTVVGKSS